MSGSAGGGQPFDNMQASLVLTQTVPLSFIFPLSVIRTFTYNFSPGGAPTASGQLLPIASNTALFSIMGTTYGGDGKTNFGLPNLQGSSIIGSGQGLGLSLRNLGDKIGSQQIALTISQIPAHAHSIPNSIDLTGVTGGSQPVSNMQPSLALNYIIAVQGIFPSTGGSISQLPFIGQIVPFTGTANIVSQGWALANGQLLAISSNTALFSILGTTYGGDGKSTFALPDLRGRTLVGVASGSTAQLGNVFGRESTTLSVSNLPSHLHSIIGSKYAASQTNVVGGGQEIPVV